MPNDIDNAVIEEVVTPQTEPQTIDVDNMSDEDFENYLQNPTQNSGEIEVQNETADTGNVEPAVDSVDEPEQAELIEEEPAKGQEEPLFFKQYATKEEYQADINSIIGKRLEKSRETEQKYSTILDTVKDFYGLQDNETAIKTLLDDMQAQVAEKKGVDVDFYKQHKETEQKAKQFEDMQKIQQETSIRQAELQKVQQRWDSEATVLKGTVKDFNLQAEISANKAFADKLANGYSVEDAYYLSHRQAPSQAKPQQPTQRKPIKENGVGNMSQGKATVNPASMPDAEFEKYIERIRRGG